MLNSSVIKYFYETNCIDFTDEKIILKYLIESDPYKSTSKLVGRLMEEIFILLCSENEDFYSACLRTSLGYEIPINVNCRKTIHPIGTGLKDTEENFPCFYEPHSWQYDIFWINYNTHQKLLIAPPCFDETTKCYTGIPAGFQVKSAKFHPRYRHSYYIPVCEFTSQKTVVRLNGKDVEFFQPIIDYSICQNIIDTMISHYITTGNLLCFFNNICGVELNYFAWERKAKNTEVVISAFDIANNLKEMSNIRL